MVGLSAHGTRLIRLLPGLMLCCAITLVACAGARAETALFGRCWLEALVLSILLGTGLRALWTPGERWQAGIETSAKLLLEIAVVLLGASVSAATIVAAGPALLVGIGGIVVAAISASFAIGRLIGLPVQMALLIACGNSICGNSAIAAVAPVIDADGDDVAAAIAFTAVLGVIVVLGLPLLGLAIGMSAVRFGALAGLTVYAVPQVIAAASAMGPQAIQLGTLVKLVRVLMLGPVCLVLSLAKRRKRSIPAPGKFVPWFIVGFLLLVAAHSLDLISQRLLAPIAELATLFTIVSMAALGLMTDLGAVMGAGGRVTLVVCLSLVVLIALSLTLLVALGIG